MRGPLSFLFANPLAATLQAIGRSQAVVEFKMDGTIITANEKFLNIFGYKLEEIVGKHHSILVEPDERQSSEYRAFWETLNSGRFQAREYKRIGKGLKEVWIQASYAPVLGGNGKPARVIKIATDITEQKLRSADFAGQVFALSKAQGVVEFDMDGVIVAANDIFLTAVGYALSEVRGLHHTIFVEPSERESKAYIAFWAALREGKSQTAEFKRIGKGNKGVWLQATYNPILDLNGKPFKIIKIATDVTAQKLLSADFAGQIDAIGKSQAVIEFDLDGNILNANENFLEVLGYTVEEVRGRHHSMLVEPAQRDRHDYKQFWAALNRGEYRSGEFCRIGKNGKIVWIQASYNPILDLNGKPFKVVKFASDVTAQVVARKKSEHMNGMLAEVAAGAEQMRASVTQISQSMERSKETANDAFGKVEAADHVTSRLAVAAQSMGGIVAIIRRITGQINLLALNATIESARAGEAGRGFAVVASEVKTLAGQAQMATDQIAKEIELMRTVSCDVVSGLDAIKCSIEEVRQHVVTTTTAVQEQSIVAANISSSIHKAALEARTM